MVKVSSPAFVALDPVDPVDPDEVDVPLSSASSVASAWARVASAAVTARCSALVSRVAMVWPAETASPMPTGTEATVPDTLNDEVAWSTFRAVPVSVRVWSMSPVVTVPSRYDGEPPLLANARVPKNPPTTRTTTATGTPRRTQSRLLPVVPAIRQPSRVQLPLVAGVMAIDVAVTAPELSLAPRAETHFPTARALAVAALVVVYVVEPVVVTVTVRVAALGVAAAEAGRAGLRAERLGGHA